MATNMEATLHIRLDSQLKKEIEAIASSFSVKPAVIIRNALEDYVNTRPAPTTEVATSKINIDAF